MAKTLPVWDLSQFYRSTKDARIEVDMASIEKEYLNIQKKYKGKVRTLTAEKIESLLKNLEELDDRVDRVASYAHLLASTDTKKEEYGILVQKVTEWGSRLAKLNMFFQIEWKKLPLSHTKKMIKQIHSPVYKHLLTHLSSFGPYTLTEAEEVIISDKDVTGRNSWIRLFTQLTGTLKYSYKGKELTESQALSLLQDKNRETRKNAAISITKTLSERKMELTHIFNTLLAEKMLSDQRRGYKAWNSSRNLSNKISDEVVNNLISSVTKQYGLVARHYTIKRKLLNLKSLYDYDRYAPVSITDDKNISWLDSKKQVLEAYGALSSDVRKIIEEFFDKKYIHAALLPNKRGGAYCSSTAASAHPYILLNFTGKTSDTRTLAHELGHGLHQYLAQRNQGHFGSGMPIVMQELASTFGEMLVFSKQYAETTLKKDRLSMLSSKIDSIIATVFRQCAMYRFEDLVHTKRRLEGELTYDQISDAWLQTQKEMFGSSVTLQKDYAGWWSYIPHFIHTPGYVYAYTFGELLSLSLFKMYQKDKNSFIPKYLNLLKSGDCDYPNVLLKEAGIDLTSTEVWNHGLNVIKDLIEEEESLMNS